MTTRTMSDADRAALWRQRIFEATAGMTRLLTEEYYGVDLTEWLLTLGAMLGDCDEESTDDPLRWQQIFFRAQALMERFLVSRYGHAALADWARFNGAAHASVEPDHGNGAADVVDRIARQAELYESVYEVEQSTAGLASISIGHCAIWDYRERARSRGVPITLKSPCTYCTHATSANIKARGYRPSYELSDGETGPGCRWVVRGRSEPVEACA